MDIFQIILLILFAIFLGVMNLSCHYYLVKLIKLEKEKLKLLVTPTLIDYIQKSRQKNAILKGCKKCFMPEDAQNIKEYVASMRLAGLSDRDVSDVLINFICNH